jgi:hypothetical protein
MCAVSTGKRRQGVEDEEKAAYRAMVSTERDAGRSMAAHERCR